MDGTSDEGLRALQGRLDRLQDELFSDKTHGRRDLDILRDIEATEALIDTHEGRRW
jgi:hypothetical protein